MPSKQENLGFLISDIARLMRRDFQQSLDVGTLTLAQARVLVHVARNEGVRQVVLAELLEVQPITLARQIDQLEQAGLVERRADPGDRRAYRVHLRPAAAPQLQAIRKVAAEVRAHAMQGLDDSQADILIDALGKMHENLSRRQAGTPRP